MSVLTGGYARQAVRAFYSQEFLPTLPPDMTINAVSRTVGDDQVVDEMIVSFTHSQSIPWMLPRIAPTARPVRIPVVAIVRFRDGKLAHEQIYWDWASVLKQIGLLADPALPIYEAETAQQSRKSAIRSAACRTTSTVAASDAQGLPLL